MAASAGIYGGAQEVRRSQLSGGPAYGAVRNENKRGFRCNLGWDRPEGRDLDNSRSPDEGEPPPSHSTFESGDCNSLPFVARYTKQAAISWDT
ncbi:hypothetical protein D3C76_1750400 [compost metagenome]